MKIKFVYFTLLLLISINVKLFSQFGGGTGTKNDPYLIYNKSHFQELSDSTESDWLRIPTKWANDKHFRLTQDIDNVTRTITNLPLFTHNGGFHGGGNKITVAMHHLWSINYDDSPFASAYGVYDSLIVDGYIINGGAGIVYGVNAAAWDNSYPASVVSNSTSNVTITSEYGYIGGIASSNSGTVINCVNNGSVTGVNIIGGIVGENLRQVTNCVNNGRITATNSGTNTNILEQPTVANGVGGIIGTGYANSNNINLGTVEGQGMVGGIIGVTNGPPGGPTTPITNNFNYGFVKGTNRVGGVVGWVATGGVNISNNSNFGVVVGEEDTGCIVGKNSGGNISNNHYDKQMCGE